MNRGQESGLPVLGLQQAARSYNQSPPVSKRKGRTPMQKGSTGSPADLAAMGLPLFACRLKENGDPIPPKGWERTPAGRVPRWKPGMALCAVMGTVFDVLDIDPRNGGNELRRTDRRAG